MYYTITRAGATKRRYRVTLIAGNNEKIAVTQTYKSKQAASEAIVLMKTTNQDTEVKDLT